MTPQAIDKMSMWQFFAMLSGSVEGNGLSSAEADELWDWLNSKE